MGFSREQRGLLTLRSSASHFLLHSGVSSGSFTWPNLVEGVSSMSSVRSVLVTGTGGLLGITWLVS
jgi:hypothetical protein